MKNPIYLDNNATTPLIPEVVEAMSQELFLPLNPSSTNIYGQKAKVLLAEARQKIATCLKCSPSHMIFTSGGTEGINLLIKSFLSPKSPSSSLGHLITSSIEHAGTHTTVLDLEKRGVDVTFLNPNSEGVIEVTQIEKAILPSTKLLVFSYANSETGVKMDIEKIAHLATAYNIPLVLDGVAILGKEPFTIPQGVAGISFSAHKLHGPQGVGLVYSSPLYSMTSLITGGGQEGGRRGGTENVRGILGFAEAIVQAYKSFPEAVERVRTLRDLFESLIQSGYPSLRINGSYNRIPNTSNLFFKGVDGETLLMLLYNEGVIASMGAACSSLALEPSRVLLEMGLSRQEANSSLRFSLSRYTKKEEIETAVSILLSLLKKFSF